MKYLLIITVITIFLFSCSQSKTDKEYVTENTVLIKVPQDYKSSACTSSVISGIELLPLETTEECLISRVNRFLITDSLIIINDGGRRILVFDTTGKFKCQIGSRGEGPGEYLEVRDMFVNDRNELEVLDFKRILKYSLSGKFINDIRFDHINEGLLYCNPSYFISSPIGGYYIWGGSLGIQEKKDGLCLMYKTDMNVKIEKGYFPVNHSAGAANYPKYSRYEDKILIDPTFGDYNVYQIDSAGNISSRYFVDFGDKSCDFELDFPNEMNKGTLEKMDNFVMEMFSLQETQKWLHLDFIYQKKLYSLFYSKEGKNSYITNVVECLKNNQEFGFWGAACAVGNSLVNVLEASWITGEMNRLDDNAKERMGLNKWSNISEFDNPVLVFYKLK